jgi:hypothetical protein
MRLLRAIASLLGRVLHRLARALLSWSRESAEGSTDPAGWADSPDGGPPEHWLRYIRQRAPWLVRGNRPAPPSIPPRRPAPPVQRPQPPRPPAGVEEHPDSPRARPRMMRRGPELPSARPEESPANPADRSERAPATRSAPRPVAVRDAGAVAPPPALRTEPGTIGRVAREPREPAHSERPPPSRNRGAALPVPVVLTTEPRQPNLTHRALPASEAVVTGADWPPLPSGGPLLGLGTHRDDSEPAVRLAEASSVGTLPPGGPRPNPIRIAPAQHHTGGPPPHGSQFREEDRWPDLPNTEWRGNAWEVPSSRSLVKEQLRLARLRAEQAGSSWSAPRS